MKTMPQKKKVAKDVIKICVRYKMVGKPVFENDLGLFCMQSFSTIKDADVFVHKNQRTMKLLIDGSHVPRDPCYPRWSEFRIEYINVCRGDAQYITAINQRHKLLQSEVFKTNFYNCGS